MLTSGGAMKVWDTSLSNVWHDFSILDATHSYV